MARGRLGYTITTVAASLLFLTAIIVSASRSDVTAAASRTQTTTTTVAATTTSTTTTLPPTTTTVKLPAPPAPGLGRGSSGPEVLALEQRLFDLKYDVGKVDGVFDAVTHQAVLAFQKIQDVARSGRATPDVVELMGRVGAPGPMLPTAEPTRVEVDLRRQVLQLYVGGQLHRVVAVSTGSGKRYCVDGQCARAVTPGGSFKVTRRITGWRTSRLGKLFNPLYFNGGIAIHGAPSVPAYPASHGCVRIPMSAAYWFPGAVPNGTPVYVLGGPRAPVPFNEQAPGDPAAPATTAAPAPESTTTTTAPPADPVVPSTTTTTVPAP